MKEYSCHCTEQLVGLASDLNVTRLELAKIQERLNRLLILCQNPYTQFTWKEKGRLENYGNQDRN